MCQTKGSDSRLELTPDKLGELETINRYVNTSITPASDTELYGVREYWALPTNRGDCEDYALLKRQKLIESGFPKSALLITVVKEQNGDGHSVLTVKTDRGDYVLDNLNNQVRLWNKTNYRFVKRQSQENQNVWVAIAPSDAASRYAQR